ncbi:MAG: hypothetical protein CME86_12670 [Herbaspirillum sp.]|nr:hypothetical protein [Herbaspirillum sp.]MBO17562.1 hypothetical protein [Herbaspirillum sp.]|tara:strand:+ start:1683 stop:1883 length:201 start_codon:yes stop_codon:yes gene_type:complete
MPGQVSLPGMLLFSYVCTHKFCLKRQKVARKPRISSKKPLKLAFLSYGRHKSSFIVKIYFYKKFTQ